MDYFLQNFASIFSSKTRLNQKNRICNDTRRRKFQDENEMGEVITTSYLGLYTYYFQWHKNATILEGVDISLLSKFLTGPGKIPCPVFDHPYLGLFITLHCQ